MNGWYTGHKWLWAGDGSPATLKNLRFRERERVTFSVPNRIANQRNPNAVRSRSKASDTAVKRIAGQVLNMPERTQVS